MRTTLKAAERGSLSGGEINKLRRDGGVPASVSTKGGKTEHCTVAHDELMNILRKGGQSALINLEGVGSAGTLLVIARDIQRHPVSHKVIHIGFQALNSREPITADVRLVLTGTPEAARFGEATLEQSMATLHVRAEPDKLPKQIEADASEMTIGSTIHVSDLAVSPDYQIVTPADSVVAVLHVSRAALAERDEPPADSAAEETPAA